MPNVDLQAVSIDPMTAEIRPTQFTKIVAILKNNGPDDIPVGEATCAVTVDLRFLRLPRKIGLSHIGTPQWAFLGRRRSAKDQVTLFFQNNWGEIPKNDITNQGFSFEIYGKSPTKDHNLPLITLASSLSATATTSDTDGNNQSVSCFLTVLPKRKYARKTP